MHELSIVMGIIDIARDYAARAGAESIDEIEMDIGCLTTVDMDAFEFAWRQGVKQTILQGAAKKINRIPGKATCMECDTVFEAVHVFDACPVCGGHLVNITEGKELRVRCLTVA